MAEEGNPEATIVGDLTDAPQIPDGLFDCAIVTQTLQFVYDVAPRTRDPRPHSRPRRRAPRDGTGPDEDLADRGRRRTASGGTTRPLAERLGAEAFGEANVEVESFGNVLAATGFLYGLAASDLEPRSSTTRPALRGRRRAPSGQGAACQRRARASPAPATFR